MSLAGARLFPGMSCSCAVPFSNRVYRLATCPNISAPLDSDIFAGAGGSGVASSSSRNLGSRTRKNNRGHVNRNRSENQPSNDGGSVRPTIANAGRRSVFNSDEVKTMYWNIYHDFTLKLTDPEFHSILKQYDIMIFAETDMLEGEEDSADVPSGYILVSLPRKPHLHTNRRGGGVALLIRDNIEFVKSHHILVLDLGSLWLVGAYIPPVTSRWLGWTDVAPFEQLWETIALCSQNEDKPVALLTDINGRIASDQVPGLEDEWPRTSSDKVINARGRQILQESLRFSETVDFVVRE